MNASNNPCQCRNTDNCVYEVLKSFMAIGGISVYMCFVLFCLFVCFLLLLSYSYLQFKERCNVDENERQYT